MSCVFAAVLFLALAYVSNKKRINLSAFSIGIDFLQIISIFTSFNFAWCAV